MTTSKMTISLPTKNLKTKKARAGPSRASSVQRSFSAFPRKARATMKYVESFSIDPAAGSLGTTVYRANSVYDPDYTGAGHQPLGFDQMAGLYAHYRVLRSTIKITLQPTAFPASSTPHCFFVGVFLSASYAPVSPDWNHLAEQPLCSYKIVNNDYRTESLTKVSSTYDVAKFFGNRSPDNVGAAVSTNPDDCAYFIVAVQDCSESQDLPVCTGVAEITYLTEFFEPEEIGQS